MAKRCCDWKRDGKTNTRPANAGMRKLRKLNFKKKPGSNAVTAPTGG